MVPTTQSFGGPEFATYATNPCRRTDPRVGTEILGYRLEALVGRGGMGVVYRAYDPRLKRDVALKLLAPEYASDERFRKRFLSETERAASLEHPNVIPIHDAGEVDGQLYLVMRYADGGDLKKLLADERKLEPPTSHHHLHAGRGRARRRPCSGPGPP